MTSLPAESTAPRYSVAGTFLEKVATQDFSGLRSTLSDEVRLRALQPRMLREGFGPQEFCDAFLTWFGGVDAFELVDAAVGEVGQRLHLRWRVRVQGGRFGDVWHVIEQQAYADVDRNGRIADLALLCSGFRPESVRDRQKVGS
jgi:hypothetical protein